MYDLATLKTLHAPFVSFLARPVLLNIKSGVEPTKAFLNERLAERHRVNGKPS